MLQPDEPEISDIAWPERTSAGKWFSKLCGQRTGEHVFAYSCLNHLGLSNSILHMKDFFGANLQYSRLRECELFFAMLQGADLMGGDLAGAKLFAADLKKANLMRAELNRAELREANLSEARLSEADLKEADLMGANLKGADLSEAYLSEDALSEAQG